MATLGSVEFVGGVSGVVPPRTAPLVQAFGTIDQVPATETVPGVPRPVTLEYRGWFSTSQRAAVYGLIGTTITADDETATARTVRVLDVPRYSEVPGLKANTLGWYVQASVTVVDWTA